MANQLEPPEIIHVAEARVACDGGGGPLGHPKVFLSLERDGRIECPYCGRLFVLDGDARPAGH